MRPNLDSSTCLAHLADAEAAITIHEDFYEKWMHNILQMNWIRCGDKGTNSTFFASFKSCSKATAMDVLIDDQRHDLTSWSDQVEEATNHFAKLLSTCIPLEPDVLRKVLANQSHYIFAESRDSLETPISLAELPMNH